jgi:hypothetical protein
MTSQPKRQEVSGKTGKGPRVGHLSSLTGILREMSSVYREMRYGQTPVNDGSRLIFALRCMRDVLETVHIERLEARVAEIAATMEGGRPYGDQTCRPALIEH